VSHRDPSPSRESVAQRHDRAVLAAIEAQAEGRFGLALDLFHESLEAAENLEIRRKIHAARINISSCYLSLGDFAAARKDLAAIILESEEPRHASAAAAQLAEALMREGRLEKAAHYVRVAVENARLAEDASREMSAEIMAGHLAIMEGRHDEAVEHHSAALALHRQAGADGRADEASLLDRVGYAMILAGRVGEGVGLLRKSLQASRRSGNIHERAEAHVDLAFAFLTVDKRFAAERHGLHAFALATSNGYATIQKNATFILMELALRSGREEDFDRWFARLQELLPDVKLSKDFFRIFDISDVINMKEF